MRAALVASITVLVYALHQDFWFWRAARPLVFGFLPIGLFYHAVYTVLISLFMWYLVSRYWPAHLEDANEQTRVSHARGAGHWGLASEREGGSGGAKPPGNQ